MSENPETTQNDSAAPLGDEARRAAQARASPEGLVAILFTDDVGSTRIRQRLGDQAAQERMRQHNQVVREQVAKHGGFEVKTWGDAFMVVFSDVGAALACSVGIQRAVAEDNGRHPKERIEVRMGLNAGQAIKEEEDFFGGAVVVAARLQGLAKGGQILVSEAVRVLAGLPEGIGYVRQGRRQLKGLEGSYDIWRVPWREERPSVLARLWARPAFRIAAPVALLAVVGGGVAAGVVLSQGSSGAPSASDGFQEVTVHVDQEGALEVVSGDCLSEDLVTSGTFEGEVTGGVPGHITTMVDTVVYVAEGCSLGYVRSSFTFTDPDGNKLYGTLEGPLAFTTLAQERPASGAALNVDQVLSIAGGSGIYDGATGTGTCDFLGATELNPDGSISTRVQGDCTYTLATGGAVLASESVIVQMVGSPAEVAVFGSSTELPGTVALAVIYRNTREEAQRGLSLRLPDLPPGEIARFEFTLQFLAAEGPNVQLVVEIEGEGFERPVQSSPITIEVVQ